VLEESSALPQQAAARAWITFLLLRSPRQAVADRARSRGLKRRGHRGPKEEPPILRDREPYLCQASFTCALRSVSECLMERSESPLSSCFPLLLLLTAERVHKELSMK